MICILLTLSCLVSCGSAPPPSPYPDDGTFLRLVAHLRRSDRFDIVPEPSRSHVVSAVIERPGMIRDYDSIYHQAVQGLDFCRSRRVVIQDRKLTRSTTMTEHCFRTTEEAKKYMAGKEVLAEGGFFTMNVDKQGNRIYVFQHENKVYEFWNSYVDGANCSDALIRYTKAFLGCEAPGCLSIE